MGQYLPIVVLAILAVLFGVLSLVASKLLAPKRPNSAKDAPYECGIMPTQESPERFPVSFYIVAMLFIMFDIEIIFVYPYAVARESLGVFGFGAMLMFSGILFATFIYELARGALEWGPISLSRPVATEVVVASANATRVSTTNVEQAGVKIVGLEGRDLERVGAA